HPAGEGRSTAHRAHIAHRRVTIRAMSQAGSAELHRPTMLMTIDPESGTANPHRSGTEAGIEFRPEFARRFRHVPASDSNVKRIHGSPESSSGKRPRCSYR